MGGTLARLWKCEEVRGVFSIYGRERAVPRCVFAPGCVCGGRREPPSAWQSAASAAARGWIGEEECVGGVDGNVWEEGLGQELGARRRGAWPSS